MTLGNTFHCATCLGLILHQYCSNTDSGRIFPVKDSNNDGLWVLH